MQEYSVNLYLRQYWRDPRLTFTSPQNDLTEIKLNDYQMTQIWLPDIYFRNEKNAVYHTVTVPNHLLRINSTGYVRYVLK